jgi:hypothetical protein
MKEKETLIASLNGNCAYSEPRITTHILKIYETNKDYIFIISGIDSDFSDVSLKVAIDKREKIWMYDLFNQIKSLMVKYRLNFKGNFKYKNYEYKLNNDFMSIHEIKNTYYYV